MIFTLAATAIAGTWTATSVHTFNISAPGPRRPFGGEHIAMTVLPCEIRADACSATLDQGTAPWASSWSWVTCRVEDYGESAVGGYDRLEVVFDFRAPALASTATTWPTSFPSYIDCVKTYGSDVHTVRVYTDQSNDRERFWTVDASTLSWGSTVSLSVPDTTVRMGRVGNIPSGVTTPEWQDATQVTSSAEYPGVFCGVDDDDDKVLFGATRSLVSAGTARCTFVHGGVTKTLDIDITL